MQVQFTRRPDNGTIAEFRRPDGVRIRLSSYDRTSLVPHDAAHLVIERAFRLQHGVWGCLSAGAEFATVEIVEGRTKHDHRARSAALRQEHAAELGLAERVVGTVLAGLEGKTRHLARDLTSTWAMTKLPPPPDPETVGRIALDELTELQHRWAGLRPGNSFTLDWPIPGRRRASGAGTG